MTYEIMDRTFAFPTWHEYQEIDYTANESSPNHPPKATSYVGACLPQPCI